MSAARRPQIVAMIPHGAHTIGGHEIQVSECVPTEQSPPHAHDERWPKTAARGAALYAPAAHPSNAPWNAGAPPRAAADDPAHPSHAPWRDFRAHKGENGHMGHAERERKHALQQPNGAYVARPGHTVPPAGHRVPPAGYVCRRCDQPGHFIQHCPTNGDPWWDLANKRNRLQQEAMLRRDSGFDGGVEPGAAGTTDVGGKGSGKGGGMGGKGGGVGMDVGMDMGGGGKGGGGKGGRDDDDGDDDLEALHVRRAARSHLAAPAPLPWHPFSL